MNRFDQILWRINGIIILVIVVCFGVGMTCVLCANFLTGSNQHKDAAVVSINKNTQEKEYLHLGRGDLFNNTSIIRMPLQADYDYSRSSLSISKGGDGRVRNYLYFDTSSMVSRWLFQGFNQSIAAYNDLQLPFVSNEKHVVGSVYEVIASGSNVAGKTNTDDRVAAFYASPDGKQVTEIIAPSEQIISVTQVSDTEFLIIYTAHKSTVGAVFEVQTGKKLRDTKIALDNN